MNSEIYIEIVRTNITRFSSMGSKSCAMIQEALGAHYGHVVTTTIDTISDLELLVRRQPDLVFLGLKRLPNTMSLGDGPSEDVWLSEYLDQKRINYTGSMPAAIKLDFNKEQAKLRVRAAGLPTAAFFTAWPDRYARDALLPVPFPLFVKPYNTGGGKGVGSDSVVRDFGEYQRKVNAIWETYGVISLVEQYLPGREFSVAILENGYDNELTVMPVELITPENFRGDRILGAAIKAADTEHVIAVTDSGARTAVGELAAAAYRALGARDFGRIDIRMNAAGEPFFLEANLVPGLADNEFVSYFNRACYLNQAMDYETIILSIAELGLARRRQTPTLVVV